MDRIATTTICLLSIALGGASSAALAAGDGQHKRIIDHYEVGPGEIMTIAGGATLPPVAPPRDVALLALCGLAVDPDSGTIYVSDTARHIVARVDPGLERLEILAGTEAAGYNGDGPGRAAMLHIPAQLAVHPITKHVYVADCNNYRIRAIDPETGVIRTVAGMGVAGVPDARLPTEPPIGPGLAFGGFAGDGSAPRQAALNLPCGVAIDSAGNVFIGDSGNHRVRVINAQDHAIEIAGVEVPPHSIMTIAGTGAYGFSGDGGPAHEAKFAFPKSVALDLGGNILVVDSLNGRLRRIDRKTGTITTIAQSIPQVNPLNLIGIEGVAVAPNGDIIYSDLNGAAVFRLSADRTRPAIAAGIGYCGHSGESVPATRSAIAAPSAVAAAAGGFFFVETGHNCVRQVRDDVMTTAIGGGPTGDGRPALEATFSVLAPIDLSPDGDLYIGDANLHAVRRIRASDGIIETFAGTGLPGIGGLGLPPDEADFVEPTCTFFPDEFDRYMYIGDPAVGVIRRLVRTTDGGWGVEHFAGSGIFGFGGDGSPAAEADFSVPLGFAKHPQTGELYIGTVWLPKIRRIARDGTISTFAGTGEEGFAGENEPATDAKFHWLTNMVFDDAGNLFMADYFNHRIRVIDGNGIIRTFAGTGEKGYNGDGRPATETALNNPNDLAFGEDGSLYFTDTNNHRVRRIDPRPPHTITTVAGTGERGFSGDGGPAIEARLNVPRHITLGADGEMYISDSLNGRIRVVRLSP